MKVIFLILLFSSSVQAQSLTSTSMASPMDDEANSQKYEGIYLDGEDKDFIEDQMTQEGLTPRDLELTEYSGEEE